MIIKESLHIDKAITFASKAAYISALIKVNNAEIEKFKSPKELSDWTIGEPFWPRLNRLKKSNPEAFFYWYKVHELMTERLPFTSHGITSL